MKLELEMKWLELEGARAGRYEQRKGEGAGHDEEAMGPDTQTDILTHTVYVSTT